MELLNFTRGTYLQSLCDNAKALMARGPEAARETLTPLIRQELEKLKQNADGYWGATESDKSYAEKLSALHTILSAENMENLTALSEEIAGETVDKVKIVFLTQETMCWPSFESLYHACSEDGRYIAQIVYIPFSHPNDTKHIDYFTTYEKMGLPVRRHDEYALARESPDIAVFMKPYDLIPMQYYIDDIEKAVPRHLYIQYGMEVGTQYIDYHFRQPLASKVWRHIAYGSLLKETAAKYGSRNGENVAVWGNPRADYYRDLEAGRKTIPASWTKKIDGRFCFLWTPHHSLDTTCGSFLDYHVPIAEYFEKRPDLFLLWRPHPLLLDGLVANGVMTKAERDAFLDRVTGMDNAILDTTSDYRQSFFASDAIVTDASTFIFEYLYTGRPLVYTKKAENAIYNADRFEKGVYVIKQAADIAPMLDQIAQGKDPLRSERTSLKKDLLFTPENGTVGRYIADRCYADLTQEIHSFKGAPKC